MNIKNIRVTNLLLIWETLQLLLQRMKMEQRLVSFLQTFLGSGLEMALITSINLKKVQIDAAGTILDGVVAKCYDCGKRAGK